MIIQSFHESLVCHK